MSWTDTTLSTLDTIARHEQEINELAGKKTRPVLYWNGSGSAPTIAFDTVGIDYIKTYSETGFATQRSVTLGTFTLVSGYYTKIDAYDVSDELLDTFTLSEGRGNYIYGSESTGTISADLWLQYDVPDTWQNKIDIAKDSLKNDIETRLGKMGYRVDFASGDQLIDIITNQSTFLIAHDYLTLCLIYRDLYFNFNSEQFQAKSKSYWADYQVELTNAFYRLAIDTSGGDNPTIFGDWTQGLITR